MKFKNIHLCVIFAHVTSSSENPWILISDHIRQLWVAVGSTTDRHWCYVKSIQMIITCTYIMLFFLQICSRLCISTRLNMAIFCRYCVYWLHYFKQWHLKCHQIDYFKGNSSKFILKKGSCKEVRQVMTMTCYYQVYTRSL